MFITLCSFVFIESVSFLKRCYNVCQCCSSGRMNKLNLNHLCCIHRIWWGLSQHPLEFLLNHKAFQIKKIIGSWFFSNLICQTQTKLGMVIDGSVCEKRRFETSLQNVFRTNLSILSDPILEKLMNWVCLFKWRLHSRLVDNYSSCLTNNKYLDTWLSFLMGKA